MSTVRNKNGSLASVRQWARQNGFTVSDRGAIPSEIMDAYRKALREWAVSKHLAGGRGRIAADVVEAFNEANIKQEVPASRKSNGHTSRPTAADVRSWARAQGMEVSDRGRIPTKILREYVSH